MTYIQAIGALAAILGIIAVFLPWASVSITYFGQTFSADANYGNVNSSVDIIFPVLLSVVALFVIFADKLEMAVRSNTGNGQPLPFMVPLRRFSNLILLLIGVIILLIILGDYNYINSQQSAYQAYIALYSGLMSGPGISLGPGFYLALLGGLGLALAGAWGVLQERGQLFPAMRQQQPYGPSASPVPQNQPYQQPVQQSAAVQPQQQYASVNNPVPPSNPGIPQQTQATSFCPNCGTATTGTVYCGKCGSRVK